MYLIKLPTLSICYIYVTYTYYILIYVGCDVTIIRLLSPSPSSGERVGH